MASSVVSDILYYDTSGLLVSTQLKSSLLGLQHVMLTHWVYWIFAVVCRPDSRSRTCRRIWRRGM